LEASGGTASYAGKSCLSIDGGTTESSVSLIFRNLPIPEMIPQLVQKAIDEGTSRMLRELKIKLGQ
jgi:hypothetical protein